VSDQPQLSRWCDSASCDRGRSGTG
jgi:hypothetical protein